MKSFTMVFAALVAACMGVAPANAALIFDDDFEGYSSQANFQATWVPGTSGTWTTAQSTSPTHSIETQAGATQLNSRTFSATTATDIVATDSNPLVWSFQFYDDAANLPTVGNTLGRSYGQLHGRRASDGALTQLLSMGLWNANVPKASNGVTSTTAELRQYYAARTAFAPGGNWILLDTGPTRSAGWHELKAIIGSSQVEYFVDGVSALTQNYVPVANPIVGWYQARIGSGLSSGTKVAYDDYRVEQVPEPSTLALFGLATIGSLGLLRRRNG
jgi:hypothetical protein